MKPLKINCLTMLMVALSIFGLGTPANAATVDDEDVTIHSGSTSSSSTDGARYEIVVDQYGHPCFRIDKYDGTVWSFRSGLFSSTKNFVVCDREPSENDITEEGKINYQIVVDNSTCAYLLNLNSGIIWMLYGRIVPKVKGGKLDVNVDSDYCFKLMTEES